MVYQREIEEIEAGDLNNQISASNQELVDNDLAATLGDMTKVYSRDWTVQTIYDQIVRGNIDLNPKFQRRNAWNDNQRSLLIESLIFNLPVPAIVLAENQDKKDSYVVLDGKQRLLTISGFINPEYKIWDEPQILGLKIKENLNGKSYEDLCNDDSLEAERRSFDNASIRCTVIFNQKSDDTLYQIFHRLNSSSVALSTQELRQALRKGEFSNFLIDTTNDGNNLQPIHKVLGLNEPDRRLLDAEIILKYIAFKLFGFDYGGNLKKFLNDTMETLNKEWVLYKDKVVQLYSEFNNSIEKLKLVFSDYDKIGRLNSRFNRNVFDVQVLYFALLNEELVRDKKEYFAAKYSEFCKVNNNFLASLKSRTSTKQNYEARFKSFEELVNTTFNTQFNQQFINYKPD